MVEELILFHRVVHITSTVLVSGLFHRQENIVNGTQLGGQQAPVPVPIGPGMNNDNENIYQPVLISQS